jgi:hypothetical protein
MSAINIRVPFVIFGYSNWADNRFCLFADSKVFSLTFWFGCCIFLKITSGMSVLFVVYSERNLD